MRISIRGWEYGKHGQPLPHALPHTSAARTHGHAFSRTRHGQKKNKTEKVTPPPPKKNNCRRNHTTASCLKSSKPVDAWTEIQLEWENDSARALFFPSAPPPPLPSARSVSSSPAFQQPSLMVWQHPGKKKKKSTAPIVPTQVPQCHLLDKSLFDGYFLKKWTKKFCIYVKPKLCTCSNLLIDWTSVCYMCWPGKIKHVCAVNANKDLWSETHTVIQRFNGLILIFFVFLWYLIALSDLVIKMLVLMVLKVGRRLLCFYNLPQIQNKLLPSALPLA